MSPLRYLCFAFGICFLQLHSLHAHAQSRSAESALETSHEALMAGDAKRAIRVLEPAFKSYPRHFKLCESLVDAYVMRIDQVGLLAKRGVAKKMLRTMESCYALNPDNETARLNLIMFHLRAPGLVGGNKSKAQRLIDEVAERTPTNGLLLKARISLIEKNLDTALSTVQKVLEMQPGNTDALYLAGLISLERHEHRDAIAFFDLCNESDADNFDCLYQIGKAAQLGEIELEKGILALQTFTQISHEDLDYLSSGHHRLSILLLRAGEKSQAMIHLHEAIDLNGSKPAQKLLRRINTD